MITPLTLLLLAGSALAQTCGSPQPLSAPIGFDRAPAAQAVFNNDLYIAGDFSRVAGTPAPGIARWNGSAWSPVPRLKPMDTITTLRVFDDHRGLALFLGGQRLPGGPVLQRWDGETWTSVPIPDFQQGSPFPRTPYVIQALQVADLDDTGLKLYAALICGSNTKCSDDALIARYDGTTWTQVGQMLPGESPSDLKVFDPDGPGPFLPQLYLSTNPTGWHECGSPEGHIFRFDAGGNTWTPISTVEIFPNGHYNSMLAFDPDGPGPLTPRLYVAGAFDVIGQPPSQLPAHNLAAWNGVSWETPGDGLYQNLSEILTLTTFDPDGPGASRPILVAGGIGLPTDRTIPACVYGFDGSAWTMLAPTLTGSDAGSLTLRAFDQPNQPPALSIAGSFNGVGGAPAEHWALLQSGQISQTTPGPDGSVRALAVFNDGTGRRLFAAGAFRTTNSAPGGKVARWDGASWSPVGGPAAFDPTTLISSLAVHNDGSGWALYAAGSFAAAGGAPANSIARWNGTSWSPVGAGLDGFVYALEVHDPDGPGPLPPRLYAGGSFFSSGGAPTPHLAVWDGSSWSSLGFGVMTTSQHGAVLALRSFDDGSGPALYIGGDAFTALGVATNLVTKWTGSQFVGLPPLDVFGHVNAFGIHDDGSGPALFAGGDFAIPGLPHRNLAKLSGNQWIPAPGPTVPPVLSLRSIAESGGQSLYIGSSDPNFPVSRYQAGAISPVSHPPGGPVNAISPAFDDGRGPSIFLGGDFTGIAVSSNPLDNPRANHLARIPICPACYANCDNSTTTPILNINDFLCFQTRFAAGDTAANCDGSTTPPTLNVADFICFQTVFAQGCP